MCTWHARSHDSHGCPHESHSEYYVHTILLHGIVMYLLTTCVAVFKVSQQLWVAQPAALLRRTSPSRSGETIPEPAAAFSFVALPHCQLDLSVPCRGCQAMVNKARSHTKLRLCPTKNFCFKAPGLVVKTNQEKAMSMLKSEAGQRLTAFL